jgi:O-antigen/teichoic acid export membrane protein
MMVSGVSFISTILVARQLSVQQFGLFAAVILAQLLILAVQNALIMGPYQVLQAEYKSRDPYLDSLFILQIGFAGVIVLAGLLIFYVHFSWIQSLWPARWWILLATGGFLMQDFLRRVLLAGENAKKAFGIDAVTNLLQVAVLLYLIAVHRLDFVNCWMAIGLTFIPSILLGYCFLPIRVVNRSYILITIRQHFIHGKWLLLTALLQWWAGNVFIVAAGLLLGVVAFGALRLAQNIFGTLNVLLQAFENYVLPRSARVYKYSRGRLKIYLKRVSVRSALFFVPVLVLIVVFARPIFLLAGGQRYLPYYNILRWLSVLYLFIFLGYPIRIAIRVLLLNRMFFTGYLLSAGFGCVVARQFIGWWGVNGVITGLVFSQLLMISYWLLSLQKKKLLLWK